MIVDDRIRDYIHSLESGQGELCDEIAKEAIMNYVPIIKQETAALLKTLVAAQQPGAILEVGTAVGYSALLMAQVMPEDCHITTIEKYEPRIPIAKENFRRSGRQDRITLLE
ncbi:MAG: O-methyltransferase, partial [Hungatella sp.]